MDATMMKGRSAGFMGRRATRLALAFLSLAALCQMAFAGDPKPGDATAAVGTDMAAPERQDVYPQCSVGTSLFSILNFFPDPGDFYQLDLGYQPSSADLVLLEAITWKYPSPTGFLKDSGTACDFPGYIRSYGISVAYQRFLWNKLFARVHATSLLQDYVDAGGQSIQHGYQLMFQFRLGYRLEFRILGQRFYLEPNVDCNYWPVDLNVPEAFAQAESNYTNFAIEPGLGFGIEF